MIRKILSSLGLSLKCDLNTAKKRIEHLENEMVGLIDKNFNALEKIKNDKRCNDRTESELNKRERTLHKKEQSLSFSIAAFEKQKHVIDLEMKIIKKRNEALYTRVQRAAGYTKKLKAKLAQESIK
jgi:formiminotetrahydrofolate cyclodeaminase